MTSPLKRLASNPTGLCLAFCVILLVAGWRVWLVAHQPAHLLDIANEIGSIAQPRMNEKDIGLIPNNDGPGLVFYQETETGLGAYICGTPDGKCTLIYDQKESGPYPTSLGWSPGGVFFAFIIPADTNHKKLEIVIYNGSSGEMAAKIAARGNDSTPKFCWLSPRSFVCSTYNEGWLVYEETSNGSWVPGTFIKKFADGEMKNITAISPGSVVWQQDDDIWKYDFTTGASDIIWESVSNKLESFTYSSTTGTLLLKCKDENGPVSIFFRPPRSSLLGAILNVTTQKDIQTDYLTLTEDHGVHTFDIITNADAAPVNFIWDGTVEEHKLAGNYLYFNGSQGNRPPGIWQYDINANSVRCLASGLQHDLRYARMVTPLAGMGTNAFGRHINYHVWEPPNVFPGKKYPLIIGQTCGWFSYEQVAANGGYYFATADRISWFNGVADWVGDVTWLYELLAKNPNIDTNRVFLCGTSLETGFLNELASEKPGLWKGAILFNATRLPDLANTHLSKMFIVGGTGDDYGREVGRLTRYQNEAALAGVPVKVLLQDGSIHSARAIATERERTVQFAKFLLEN